MMPEGQHAGRLPMHYGGSGSHGPRTAADDLTGRACSTAAWWCTYFCGWCSSSMTACWQWCQCQWAFAPCASTNMTSKRQEENMGETKGLCTLIGESMVGGWYLGGGGPHWAILLCPVTTGCVRPILRIPSGSSLGTQDCPLMSCHPGWLATPPGCGPWF